MKAMLVFKPYRVLVSVMVSAIVALPLAALPYGSGTYGTCTYNDCGITLTSSATLAVSLTASGADRYVIDKDVITVDTGASTGYMLTLQSNSAETGLVGATQTIAAVSGTFASPATLSSNTWGYRLDGLGGFGAGPTVAGESSSSSLTFAGLSANGSPTTLKTTTAAASNQTTDVWYGVRVAPTLPSGVYTRTVIYTATTNE